MYEVRSHFGQHYVIKASYEKHPVIVERNARDVFSKIRLNL